MSDQLNVTLRSAADEATYQADIKAGRTTRIELLPSLKIWEYWRLVENGYPYTMAFKTHHLLMPKRATVAERFDLNAAERAEFDQILRDFVYPKYDLWFENCPKRRSAPHIYHVHFVMYHDSRKEMKL